MLANYGYVDATGEYFITVDTDKCDGCGCCVETCPEGLFEVSMDDYGKLVARVKEKLVAKISYCCPGFDACARSHEANCHSVCECGALEHSW